MHKFHVSIIDFYYSVLTTKSSFSILHYTVPPMLPATTTVFSVSKCLLELFPPIMPPSLDEHLSKMVRLILTE